MRRPKQHLSGELGENQVARLLLEQGWIVQKLYSDYGFDYLIQRTQDGEVTTDFAFIQVKTSQSSSSGLGKICRVQTKHLKLWQESPIPCFIALVHLPAGHVYLLDCKAVVQSLGFNSTISVSPRSFAVPFTPAAELDDERLRRLAGWVSAHWITVRRSLIPTSVTMQESAGFLAGTTLTYLIEPGIGRVLTYLTTLNSQLRNFIGDELAGKVTRELLRDLLQP